VTYCVAWTTSESVYLVADSAVTTVNKLSDERVETSFGEKQGKLEAKNKYVYENAYKIYSNDNVAIGLIGNAEFGNSFIQLLLSQLEFHGVDDAIKKTLINYTDLSEAPCIQIVIAFYENEAKLYTIDNKATPYVEYDNNFVVFGSPSEDLATYTKAFYNGFMETWEKEFRVGGKAAEFFLVRMLALLQVYGVHNCTLNEGIGGAYTGILVNNLGVQQQPDICYVISGENPTFNTKMLTSVHVGNDHFCIINTNTFNVLIPNLGVNSETENDRLKSSLTSAIDTFDSGKFKYYIFLNLARHAAVIVNMDNNIHHKILSIDIRDEVKGTIGLIISEELQNSLNVNFEPVTTLKDAQIMLVPYMPASKEKISFIEEKIKEMRVSKFYTEEKDGYKFLLIDNGGTTKWFYGTEQTIFPFIKHYKDTQQIKIIDLLTDSVIVEYMDGNIIFPETKGNLLSEIVKKKGNKDLYIFEFLTKKSKCHTLYILSGDYDAAHKDAITEIDSLFDEYWNLIFVGVKFYHPAYFF